MEYHANGVAEAAAVPDPAGGHCAPALCPVTQYGTQLIVSPEIRDPNSDFIYLFTNVVWGNTQEFLPISLMIGGCRLTKRTPTPP